MNALFSDLYNKYYKNKSITIKAKLPALAELKAVLNIKSEIKQESRVTLRNLIT